MFTYLLTAVFLSWGFAAAMPAAVPLPATPAAPAVIEARAEPPAIAAVVPAAVERGVDDEFLDSVEKTLERRIKPTNQCTVM